jgi:hypothetical protein
MNTNLMSPVRVAHKTLARSKVDKAPLLKSNILNLHIVYMNSLRSKRAIGTALK